MKTQTTKTLEANPKYTALMNRERELARQIESLQKQLRDVRNEKNATRPFVNA